MTRHHPVPLPPRLSRRLAAEAFGTFVLVLGGCGAAVLAGDAIGNAGIAAAFGLSVLAAAYAVGHVSGGHFNPAVSLGAAVAGRLPWRSLPAYVATQVVAAVVAAGVLLALASGRAGFDVADGSPPTASATPRRPATPGGPPRSPRWSSPHCSSGRSWASPTRGRHRASARSPSG